jgi:flagellar protein FlaJ
LIQGIVTVITTGGDVRAYLKTKAEHYQYVEKMDVAERIDLFATIGESYVTLCMVAPLLFIIMFMVMGIATGSPIAVYGSVLIAIFMIPITNLIYITIIKSFETERIEYVRNVKKELTIVSTSVAIFAVLMYLGMLSGSIDLMVFGLIALIAPYGLYMHYKVKEISQIEDRFPDFLRDLGEDRRVGTTLMQSMRNAAKRNYGRLTPLVKRASVLISWNVPFMDVLRDFTKRYPSSRMKESVDIVEQGIESGGSVAEIIIDTATHAKTRRTLETERRRKLMTYLGIVYISFVVFLIIVALVSSLMVPMMGEIAEMSELLPGMGGESGTVESLKMFYQSILFVSAVTLAIGGGVVCGVLTDKNVFVGLRHSAIMVIIAYVVFKVAIF